MVPIDLADLVRRRGEAEGEDDRHHHGDREGAAEIADEHQAPVAQHAAERHARTLVDQRQRTQHEHAGQQVEAEQIEHAEADRKQDRADDRHAGLDVDGDREGCGQRQDRAGHIGADDGVARRHEDLGLRRHRPSWSRIPKARDRPLQFPLFRKNLTGAGSHMARADVRCGEPSSRAHAATGRRSKRFCWAPRVTRSRLI